MNEKTPRKKGGRPKKSATERKQYRFTLKVCTAEKFDLLTQTGQAGLTPAEYIRQSVANSVVKERKTPATPTPSSNAPSSSKNIDLNTVYMFFEELKVAFEKGQAKQSDGSQVQTEVVNPEAFQKILAEELPEFSIQVEGPTLDYSKIPKPKDYTQSFTDLGKKVESKDSATAKEVGKLSTAIGKLEDAVKTANATPKVQKVEKTIKLDIDSWKCLGCAICSFIISIFLGVWIFLQYDEIDRYKDTDLKYRLIQMNGSVSSVGLDSIEVWFQDPERVKNFNKMVTEYEQRMDKLRRSTIERDRLNSEINELNSQNNSNKR